MKKLVIVIFFLKLSIFAWCQSTIFGVLIDSTSLNPVEYANIYIKSDPSVGLTSNEIGEFSFNLLNNFEQDTLCISAIGYSTKYIPINSLIGRMYDKQFLLSPNIYQIESVSVFAPSLFAKELVKDAVELLKRNYNPKRHILNGFYRQIGFIDSTNVNIIEADIAVLDQGIQKKAERVKMAYNEIRRNDDKRHPYEKSLSFKLVGKLLKKSNEIYNVYDYNFFKDQKAETKGGWFDEKFIDNRDFFIKGNFIDDTDTILVIIFKPKVNKIYSEDEGEIYINKQNKAILKIAHKSSFNDIGIKYYRLQTFFRNSDGLYYPKIIKSESYFNNEFKQDFIQFYNVSSNKESFKYFRTLNKLSRLESVYDIKYNYNETFWNNYNMLQLIPIEEWQKIVAEKYKPLSEQYKNPK